MEQHGPLSLVVRWSRVAGLAPYGSLQQLRASRPYLIYNYGIYIIMAIASVCLMLADYHYSDEGELKKETSGVPGYVWGLYVSMVLLSKIMHLYGVLKGPRRLRTIVFVLKRVNKICRSINALPQADSLDYTKAFWIYVLTSVVFFLWELSNKTYMFYFNIDSLSVSSLVRLASRSVAFLENLIHLLALMQFVVLATRVSAALRTVNASLNAELSLDGIRENDYDDNSTARKFSTGQCFIKVNTRVFAKVNRDTAPARLREHACAYVSACDLARTLNQSEGAFLFALITFYIIDTLFHQDTIFNWYPESGDVFLKYVDTGTESAWCLFIFFKLLLLVNPCHYFTEELERTRFLVAQIICETTASDDALLAELELFYRHLVLNQPSYNALGIYTIGRPLLVTVVALVFTYSAIIIEL